MLKHFVFTPLFLTVVTFACLPPKEGRLTGVGSIKSSTKNPSSDPKPVTGIPSAPIHNDCNTL